MSRHWPLALVPAFVLATYVVTLSPAVGLIDSGELAAGCHLLNILHPTGYPLYTMLGRLASLVPVAEVVNRVALLSALLAAAGTAVFLWLALRMGLSSTASGVMALVLGLSYPVWAVAVDVEVYSLGFVLLGLLWVAAEQAEQGSGVPAPQVRIPDSGLRTPAATQKHRGLLVFAYLCGLAMTNHMSAASAVAGAVVCVVPALRGGVVRLGPRLLLSFFLGLSVYLFLVLRAQAGPLFAWGNPHNLERLWWHLTGRQYQVWMFSQPLAAVMANAGRGAALVGRSFLWVLLVPVAVGAVRLSRTRRALAIGLGLSAVLSVGYAVNYSIPDIESYYIPCVLALSVFGAVGLDWLGRRMGKWQHALWLAGAAALCLNYQAAGKQGDYVALDHARSTLASARENAIVLTDWWDFYSPTLYLQHVRGERPDLCVIDKELLRRSWYFQYLGRQYPWLAEHSGQEIERFRVYLDQFEHSRLRDAAGIQRAYIAMITSFIEQNPERPVYTTFDAGASADAQQLLPGVRRVPVGLLYELRRDTVIPEFDYSRLSVRLPGHAIDSRTRACLEHYRYFVMQRAWALLEAGRRAEAEEVVRAYMALPVSRFAPMPDGN